MKRSPLAVSLFTVAVVSVIGWTGCDSNKQAPPPAKVFRNQVAIELVTQPNGTKKAIMVYDNFYVHKGSAFKFYTDGCDLVFKTPPTKPDGFFKNTPGHGPVVNTVISDTLGTY